MKFPCATKGLGWSKRPLKKAHQPVLVSTLLGLASQQWNALLQCHPPKKYATHDSRQKQLDDALVLFVTCDLVSFSVVDSPYFHNLVSAADPRYQMLTRKHLVKKTATGQINSGEKRS